MVLIVKIKIDSKNKQTQVAKLEKFNLIKLIIENKIQDRVQNGKIKLGTSVLSKPCLKTPL